MKSENCITCKYVRINKDGGFCKRFPPSPMAMPHPITAQMSIASVYPMVNGDGWCGEYRCDVSKQ